MTDLTLIERIRANAAAKANERKDGHKIAHNDVSLRGTGLTKREAAKNTRAYERDAAKAVQVKDSELAREAEEQFEQGTADSIEAMREAQRIHNIILDESQQIAVQGISHDKVAVLIGAAGTGKTTVTKVVCETLKQLIGYTNSAKTQFITVEIAPGHKERLLLSDAISRGFAKPEEAKQTLSIAFAAYTGRASQQLKRVLPEDLQKNTSTIHSLLGYAPVDEDFQYIDKLTGLAETRTRRVFRPSFTAACKLPYKYVVLDEGGMIPVPLFNELIDALETSARILIIGDINQLPPVYGKSVLGYAMRHWPVYELTTIHRQSGSSGAAIITNAHNVLRGKQLDNFPTFHLIGNNPTMTPAPGGQSELQKYMLQVVKKLHEIGKYNPYTDQIIVPQNKGMVGQIALNEHLVTMFNPEVKENGIIVNKRLSIHTGTAHVDFAVRDKVMITSNINSVDPPITNGMIGIVETININGRYDMKRAQIDFNTDDEADFSAPLDLDLDNMNLAMSEAFDDEETKEKEKQDETDDQRQSSHVMRIKFDNGQTYECSTAGDYRRVQYGYAVTCHKAQGGEYPNIIILCHSVNATMLTREWLYTATTRARENVYIICNQRGIDKALGRQVIKGTTLEEKIRSYVIETGTEEEGLDTSKFPILWKPEKV